MINSKKEYNIKLIAVVAIVSIILVSSVAAGGAYYLLSDEDGSEEVIKTVNGWLQIFIKILLYFNL